MSNNFKSTTSKVFTALVLVMLLLASLPTAPAGAAETVYTTSGTWVAPAGVTSVKVEVWGGGGKGSTRNSSGNGGGGGGGAYSMGMVSVTPGNSYTYTVGAGATTTAAGGDSWFGSATTVMAKGGGSVTDNNATGASGGASGSGYGSTKYSGGAGVNGAGTYGGGGGSSAGTAANGNTGSTYTGGVAPTGGGAGANGRSGSNGAGDAATQLGGGGGGSYRTSGGGTVNGGNGFRGQVKVSYTITIGDGTSPAAKFVKASDTNKAVSAFTVVTEAGTETISALTVTISGTGRTAVSTVKLYRDVNSNNEYDAGDTSIATAAYTSGTGVASFTALTLSATTTVAQ